jgi:hypothetical protein
MDCRVIGERSDAVLRTAMPGNDRGASVSTSHDSDVAPNYSFARSTYDPSSVITTTRVPAPMNGGTLVRTPFDSVAGL